MNRTGDAKGDALVPMKGHLETEGGERERRSDESDRRTANRKSGLYDALGGTSVHAKDVGDED